MLNLNEVDVFSLLNDKNPSTYKELKEILFNIDNEAKTKLDRGVSPAEFDKLEAVRSCVQCAQSIIDNLYK